MKIFWLCKIFGHKFIANRTWVNSYEYRYEKLEHCNRCGLTIEEIKNEE